MSTKPSMFKAKSNPLGSLFGGGKPKKSMFFSRLKRAVTGVDIEKIDNLLLH